MLSTTTGSERIRGVKASASLKQIGLEFLRQGISEYPRCKSLGLIEAILAERANEARWCGIRGVKASASLKLPLLGQLGHVVVEVSEV